MRIISHAKGKIRHSWKQFTTVIEVFDTKTMLNELHSGKQGSCQNNFEFKITRQDTKPCIVRMSVFHKHHLIESQSAIKIINYIFLRSNHRGTNCVLID